MNVYFSTREINPGIRRIAAMLQRYAPRSVSMVESVEQADLVVFYVIGRRDHLTVATNNLLAQGKSYAMIQIALRSTRTPRIRDWTALWAGAKTVWSYYDIEAMAQEENEIVKADLYHTPLGVDNEVFYMRNLARPYLIEANGAVPDAECIYEVFDAADKKAGRVAHYGVNSGLPFRRNVDYYGVISDHEVSRLFNQCQYASGLRRKDGFELVAAEGILCGARPILFDNANYRQWFDGFGEFIPEMPKPQVIESLAKIFEQPRREVTADEIERAKLLFDWQSIVSGFWERCV